MQRTVRPASALDREPVLDVVEAAFVTEPAFAHFFGDAYQTHAREFLSFLFDLRLAGGLMWVEEVDAADRCGVDVGSAGWAHAECRGAGGDVACGR